MIMLALAPPSIAVVSFDHRCATPIPHVVTGRPGSSPHRSHSKQASNARRQQTPSIEIPIASDAQPRHTSRGFLLWRFAYAGPRCPPRHHHGAGIRKPSQQRSFAQRRFFTHSRTPDIASDGECAEGTGAFGVIRRSGTTSRSKWASFSINQTSCRSAGPRGPAVWMLKLSTTATPVARES